RTPQPHVRFGQMLPIAMTFQSRLLLRWQPGFHDVGLIRAPASMRRAARLVREAAANEGSHKSLFLSETYFLNGGSVPMPTGIVTSKVRSASPPARKLNGWSREVK